jgi:hypothetical protein
VIHGGYRFGVLLLCGWVLSACTTATTTTATNTIASTSTTRFDITAFEAAIMPVAAWGGTPALATAEKPLKSHRISHITLHHQGETFPPGKDMLAYLRNLQTWSRGVRGWVDVPYHYVIDLDGKLYAGRDITIPGDTNTAYNPAGHALIEVVGNYENIEPSAAQLEAIAQTMAWVAIKHSIPIEKIASHKDYASTACPGKNLYRYIENGFFKQRVSELLSLR